MTHSLDRGEQHFIIHGMDDAIIANADAERMVAAMKFLAADGPRIPRFRFSASPPFNI